MDGVKELLLAARGSVKHAIVMHKLGCSLDEAEQKLGEADGFVWRVLS